jgi:hypothetical protein
MTSSLPFFIEALCASLSSPSDQPEDVRRTLQGNPRDSPKVTLLDGLMILVLRTKDIGQWPFTLVDGP